MTRASAASPGANPSDAARVWRPPPRGRPRRVGHPRPERQRPARHRIRTPANRSAPPPGRENETPPAPTRVRRHDQALSIVREFAEDGNDLRVPATRRDHVRPKAGRRSHRYASLRPRTHPGAAVRGAAAAARAALPVMSSDHGRLCQGTDDRVSVQLTIRRRSANSHTPSCSTNVSR